MATRLSLLMNKTFLFFYALLNLTVLTAQETEKIYLSGVDFEHPVKWEFMVNGGRNSNQWTTINVPSHWELEGFGEYTYGRWYKELNLKEPSKEEGFYKHTFMVPASTEGKKVTIVFGGAMTDTKVKINGKSAGEIHQGGFYEFSYDITSLLNYGEDNLLEVHVSKHSANASVNAAERKADWWLFGGIYRPVWLEVTPKSHIAQVAIDAKMDGTVTSELTLGNFSQMGSMEVFLTKVNSTEKIGSEVFILNPKKSSFDLKTKFSDIAPWSPETPNLYDLHFSLQQNGETVHNITKRIGFRTLEFIKKDGIYVNGKKIIMKGINRHTIWPESGRSTSKRISIMDANLLKEMNMNAVRNHYPPDTHFLEACDSLGLFVLDELAGWQNGYDTEVGTKLITEMVRRDVNHPSVLMWDHGNEGGWNYELDSLFYQLDPQKRIVIHPWSDFDGWDTHHYPAYQTGVHRFVNGENVFFPTEFMHGTYDNGHGAGLEDFWNHFKESPLFAGGFMWAFSDAAVRRSDWEGPQLYDSKGSLAPDGILGPHREKEGSFFTVKEIWAPIQFAQMKITRKFDGTFYITNDYIYTNLNTCALTYRIVQAPENAFYADSSPKIIEEGTLKAPNLEPKETGKVHFPVTKDFFKGDWLEITAHDQFNKEIYTWTWPIHNAPYYSHKFISVKNGNPKAKVVKSNDEVILSGGGVSLKLDTESGKIKSVSNKKEKIPFNNGPEPIGMKARVKSVDTYTDGQNAVCLVNYTGGIHSIKWTMYPDGRLHMEMIALKNAGRNSGFDGAFVDDNISAFGISFNFPEDGVEGFKWLGRGPYRVWKNRIKGTTYGLWEKEYNNTITGESFENLIYPEFKGYHANMYGAALKANNHGFKVFSESQKVFLRLFTPEEPKNGFPGSHPQPEFPSGDISFLYEIPAMRSFKPIEHHGPHSQPASIRIKNGDEGIPMNLWFDFRAQSK